MLTPLVLLGILAVLGSPSSGVSQNIYLSSSLHPSPSFLLALVPTTPRRASGPALLSLAVSVSLFPSLCLF